MNDFTKNGSLILLIQKNSPKGYAMLYEQYSAVLYGVVHAIVNDIQQAEQALAQTFDYICGNINKYNPSQSTFVTWAMQVARRVSISHLQKPASTGRLLPVAEPVAATVELLMMPVVNVPLIGHDMLVLIMQGYKAEQVSQQFNIPVETVKADVRKALRSKTVGA